MSLTVDTGGDIVTKPSRRHSVPSRSAKRSWRFVSRGVMSFDGVETGRYCCDIKRLGTPSVDTERWSRVRQGNVGTRGPWRSRTLHCRIQRGCECLRSRFGRKSWINYLNGNTFIIESFNRDTRTGSIRCIRTPESIFIKIHIATDKNLARESIITLITLDFV